VVGDWSSDVCSSDLGISGDFIRQKFERDEAVQARVLGLVHDAHTSTTQFFDD